MTRRDQRIGIAAIVLTLVLACLFLVAINRVGNAVTAAKQREIHDNTVALQKVAAAQVHACEQINTYGSQFGKFIDSTVSRSKASTEATLASRTASAEQKRVAARNYASVVVLAGNYHRAVRPLTCGAAP